MSSTNGHGPKKTAILYARVSSDEQAKKGYSIGGQLDEIKEHAAELGWEVVGVETDPGYSRETLRRPGLDRVRGAVAGGGVDTVLAWKRDRFGASPVPQLLADEFAENGTKLCALDDSGEGYDAEFINGVKDLIAKRELRDMARRSRMGKLAKAREGKIVGSHRVAYGFCMTETKDGYEVDEEKMIVVKRIFRMLAVEKSSLRGVKKVLEAAGIPTPTGKKYWSQGYLRNVIISDLYKPHTLEEIHGLVSPTVAGRLAPDGLYGIMWFNRQKIRKSQVANDDLNGDPYRYSYHRTLKDKEEWIAIPVPDSGVPREWVDAAREAIKDNRRPSACSDRFWELSGGIFRCGGCGRVMQTTGIRGRNKKLHHYYRCPNRIQNGKEACPHGKYHRADVVEPQVWEWVSGLLKDPQRLASGLDKMIEEQRNRLHRDPEEEAARWVKRIEECAAQRENRLQQHAEGLIGLDELRLKLIEIEESREIAEQELHRLRNLGAEIARMEQDKQTLLASYAVMVPERLDALPPEKRHQIYKMLRLGIATRADGVLEATGVLVSEVFSSPEISRTRTAWSTSARSTGIQRVSPRP